LQDHKKKMKLMKFILMRMTAAKLHLGFKIWEEEVFQKRAAERSRLEAVKLLRKSLLRILQHSLSRSFQTWLSTYRR
tara:strand:- start:219 stop:449 length:231 start_codon:yes stop_codon:yes gene_type:complete